ncbi:glycosyltransferase 87 family protein [Nocardia sp. NPDC004068]|uniref:glycosyltransferase 87 family protein n=1 Tax=Nocardia sp. NPDC004068 TaxID=3364303 RepID=UPI00368F072B
MLGIVAVLAVVLVFTLVDPWLDRAGILVGGLDVHVYRDGAWKILHGHPLYTEPSVYGLFYTYTPFSTLLFIPIALYPWGWVTNTWLLVNLGVLFGCVLLCWRILGYRLERRIVAVSAVVALACVFVEPVRTTLYYGQINLVLMALVLWDCARREGDRWRGVGVGLAAGIKLVPLFYVVYFLALRRYRTAVTAAAVFLATVVVSALVLPADSRQYWTSTFFHSERIAQDTHAANQSLRGAIAHLLGHSAPVWLWVPLAVVVAVAGLSIAVAWYRRDERLLSIAVAGMTACGVSPFSWSHHWVWLVPLLVHLVHRAQTRPWWWALAGLVYLAAGSWTYEWTPQWVVVGLIMYPPTWVIAPILMNLYVTMLLILLAASAIRLWWPRPTARVGRGQWFPLRPRRAPGTPVR